MCNDILVHLYVPVYTEKSILVHTLLYNGTFEIQVCLLVCILKHVVGSSFYKQWN